MEIKNILGSTFCIDTGMTYIPFYKVNDEEIIMLDSGWAEGEQKGIDELLEKNNFKVIGIICSHAHMDHIGNNSYLKKKYNCVIAMPTDEALFCNSLINLKVYYSGHTLSEVTEHYGHLLCETDIMISDYQDKIFVKGIQFKILHTRGHSPAHICIITPDDVAYLGDLLISYEVMEGAKMPYAFILREDLKSKTKLYDLKCNRYVLAHKGIYNDVTKLIADNLSFYKDRAANIYDLIDGPMTLDDIMKALINKFKFCIKTKNRYAIIEKMARCYVEYLHETGCLELNMVDSFPKYSKAPLTSS